MNRNHHIIFLLSLCVLLLTAIFAVISKNIVLPLLMFAGIGGLFAFFYNPRLMLFVILFIRIQLDLLWWLPFSIGSINLLAAFTGGITILGTIMAIMRFSNDIERHPCTPYFLTLIIFLILGATRAFNSKIMVDEFFRIYSPILMIFLATSLFNQKKDWEKLMFVFLFSSFIPISASFYHLITGQMSTITLDGVQRLLGGYQNLRNHSLMMFIFSCCGVYFFFQSKNRMQRFLYGGYCLTTLSFLYLTQTRATLIVFGVFTLTFLYLTERKSWLFAGLIISIPIVALNPSLLQRFSEFTSIFSSLTENSAQEIDLSSMGSGRFGLWSNSMEAYLEHSLPEVILGLGFGYHWILTRGAYSGFALVQGGFVDTHNDMLRILYQIGPIGLLLFCFMLFHGIKTSWWVNKNAPTRKQRELGAILLALCIAIIINNILSNGINSRTTFGWCFWYLIAISYISKREILNERIAQAKHSLAKDIAPPDKEPTTVHYVRTPVLSHARQADKSNIYTLPSTKTD
ncbi:MAG: hypothetical protein CL916_05805 [Deltaproteobacteria bacterium]|nr:hypothetical protein [Deltaproteobacteria bacterium]